MIVKRVVLPIICMALLFMATPDLLAVPKPQPERLIDTVRRISANHELDWKLVVAIAVVESHFNPRAVSRDGRDRGLMQIRDVLAKHFNVAPQALFDVNVNLTIACKHLAYLIDRYGFDGGLQAYNVGEFKYRGGTRNRSYLDRVNRVYRGIDVVTEGA